ncbi:general odorant-binding protein 99a-like [Anastrepha obliqua]|uniref:general odorant-binding protein 99a-like n=1 Tax=Anastrepha obliqua TaxID=95512 RepID=UPI002409CCD1|nr:general odorant-binding protein 99a-like [Anastrepha obliqua]
MRSTTLAFIVFLFTFDAFSAADFEEKSEDDFLSASERCFEREHLPSSYQRRFDNFEYPDEEIVHRYVHCIWKKLELWNDRTGFNVEHIAALYRDKANTEVLVPILSDCNRNAQNESKLKWCYDAFKCMLNSRVGQWFKEDVGRKLHDTKKANHVD